MTTKDNYKRVYRSDLKAFLDRELNADDFGYILYNEMPYLVAAVEIYRLSETVLLSESFQDKIKQTFPVSVINYGIDVTMIGFDNYKKSE